MTFAVIPPCFTSQEHIARLALARSHRVGAVTFANLLQLYGSATEALQRLPQLAARGGALNKIVPCTLADAQKEYEQGHAMGAHLLVRGQESYPALLEHIPDAPPVLWAMGNVPLLQRDMCGFVGTRNASAAGMRLVGSMAQNIGAAGYITVSGLARGIDTAVHQASVLTGTVGVVAGGIDVVYPPENASLRQQMIEHGVLVAEMPPCTEPIAKLFPRRNRIIAGLGMALVVAEAALKSGSLITAHYALDYGRDVMAIPGNPADPRAEGPNRLIQQGAQLVHNATDVLRVLAPLGQVRESALPPASVLLSPPTEDDLAVARGVLLSLLSPQGVAVDVLIRLSQLSPSLVYTILLELELAGRLERSHGNTVSLVAMVESV